MDAGRFVIRNCPIHPLTYSAYPISQCRVHLVNSLKCMQVNFFYSFIVIKSSRKDRESEMPQIIILSLDSG